MLYTYRDHRDKPGVEYILGNSTEKPNCALNITVRQASHGSKKAAMGFSAQCHFMLNCSLSLPSTILNILLMVVAIVNSSAGLSAPKVKGGSWPVQT
jgi:hypothetical protein